MMRWHGSPTPATPCLLKLPESRSKLLAYAQRLRDDPTNEHVRMYDEGAGVSGQKRIDERED